ncbi:putative MBOAT family protein [Colletotrichum sublineola]|uniref:Putative MBOAT family protein n=1 Tax=Colletotrichum sublineola TaxID=1173701 RepID=A0A066XA14_COLSU|nr:putative MBOAT family protein [Colletotrichum sublineola]
MAVLLTSHPLPSKLGNTVFPVPTNLHKKSVVEQGDARLKQRAPIAIASDYEQAAATVWQEAAYTFIPEIWQPSLWAPRVPWRHLEGLGNVDRGTCLSAMAARSLIAWIRHNDVVPPHLPENLSVAVIHSINSPQQNSNYSSSTESYDAFLSINSFISAKPVVTDHPLAWFLVHLPPQWHILFVSHIHLLHPLQYRRRGRFRLLPTSAPSTTSSNKQDVIIASSFQKGRLYFLIQLPLDAELASQPSSLKSSESLDSSSTQPSIYPIILDPSTLDPRPVPRLIP